MVQTETPQAVELPGHRWTLKKLVAWIQSKCTRSVSKNTIRTLLRQSGFSWKKCKKLLAKAKPEQRRQYIEQLSEMFLKMCAGQAILVYIDEAHFHQDLDLGYSWSMKGVPQWVKSTSPGLNAKVNFYGAYDFARGQCFLWQIEHFHSDHTIAFFQELAKWLDVKGQTIYIILDGAPWHRSNRVAAAAKELGFTLIRLPAYSPDLNPIEGLWKWMREEITQLHCHPTLQALAEACHEFIHRINLEPNLLLKRLWPKFDLDPDFEKLLVSS
ncbi:MAG: IS630 family transposase [Candidatus Promineifilaceae bacterium]|nr:IS630 family transposase [Candidatus Promineifilaceae bacterium]